MKKKNILNSVYIVSQPQIIVYEKYDIKKSVRYAKPVKNKHFCLSVLNVSELFQIKIYTENAFLFA